MENIPGLTNFISVYLPYNWALATSAAVTNNELLRTTSIGIITLLITTTAGIAVFKNQDIK